MWISAVSATFFRNFSGCFAGVGELFCRFQRFQLLFSRIFPAVSLGLGSCFVDFSGFSYLFWRFFRLFRWGWGAVLWISAVSATFFRNFSSFWAGLGCCFRSFMDYSYPRPVCYQPMAIVHCANLVWGILC